MHFFCYRYRKYHSSGPVPPFCKNSHKHFLRKHAIIRLYIVIPVSCRVCMYKQHRRLFCGIKIVVQCFKQSRFHSYITQKTSITYGVSHSAQFCSDILFKHCISHICDRIFAVARICIIRITAYAEPFIPFGRKDSHDLKHICDISGMILAPVMVPHKL